MGTIRKNADTRVRTAKKMTSLSTIAGWRLLCAHRITF
jgi:hypothetical protein